MGAEPAIVVERRKELTYLLCQAAELEHALMCQYLYAAFSLKSTAGPSLRADQLEAVERWRRVIFAIAGEEMLHWAMVQNLLTAVGSAPYVSRPHMPHQAGGYPPGVQLRLLPFGEAALQHFVYLERPEGVERTDATGFEPTGPPLPPMRPEEVVSRGQNFATQGHLYRSSNAGSPAWLTSWARTGCSSARRSSRPTRPSSAGPTFGPSSTWRAPTGPWSA
jgi:Ferritin-like